MKVQSSENKLVITEEFIFDQNKLPSGPNNHFKISLEICSRQYSQISVIRTSIIQNYWVIQRRWTVPTFFPIIYCNKTTYYSNFDYPKNSIFRSDSSVPITENAIKVPFKIRSPSVTHGDHDFFVWSSSIYTPE